MGSRLSTRIKVKYHPSHHFIPTSNVYQHSIHRKIDSKKQKYQELLEKLESKREIMKSRYQQVHDKHVAFLKMEQKKNKVLKVKR